MYKHVRSDPSPGCPAAPVACCMTAVRRAAAVWKFAPPVQRRTWRLDGKICSWVTPEEKKPIRSPHIWELDMEYAESCRNLLGKFRIRFFSCVLLFLFLRENSQFLLFPTTAAAGLEN